MTAAATSDLAPPSGLFDGYRPGTDIFDEMMGADGVVRPHWRTLAESIGRLGADGLDERRESVRALLREHGVTYNVYADGRSAERSWELGALPMVISAAEWRSSSRASSSAPSF